ncbi:hypothetical protein LDENG_00252110 [Lucifuga dentata]|nr:hypothetical protein LDENG_00252110 [Lucifuga dentata]
MHVGIVLWIAAVFLMAVAAADEMVKIPDGKMIMGANAADGRDGESPSKEVKVEPFKMDKYPVTNADFRDFVRAEKYKTEAETFGWSFVFQDFVSEELKSKVTQRIESAPWWLPIEKVFWRQPAGPGSGIRERLDFPVVQVSWNDALAFCQWKKKRLPTEEEWEWAARGGLQGRIYPWGNKFQTNRTNLWQGLFPGGDTAEDGYHGTSPVTAFPPQNSYGLYDMMGNTWEWTATRFPGAQPTYVLRGASWIDTVDGSANHKAQITTRMGNTPDSASDNLGFRLQDRPQGSLRIRYSAFRPTVLYREPAPNPVQEPEPESCVSTIEPEEPEEAKDDAEQEDLFCGGLEEGNSADPLPTDNFCVTPVLNLKDVGQEELKDENDKSEGTDGLQIISLVSSIEETEEGSEPVALAGQDVRKYIDGTLPDLIRTGRPLGRRRTLGHVSDTLKEVRREVELSRRRSIKLKAQVDKLQERRDAPGWSQHRERVTEEVLSVLRLLYPLTEQPESSTPEPSDGENRLDTALSQLQFVARKLAITHTKKDFKSEAEESAILQQALRDRDDAVEKKKAMEEELLRSKTEMMSLNNQLLEAAQKRLELSLELEAWKEDVQQILQQQVQIQQQAEAQKKPTRLGILKRSNKTPVQAPSSPSPASPTTSTSQIFMSRAAASLPPAADAPPTNINRTWRDKLRRGKTRRADLETVVQDLQAKQEDGFQVISLD